MRKKNAMTPDDILKLKAVALYVINACKKIDYFRLFKIIYFADREHYALYGRRLVNDTFFALPNGPVPSNLYNAIKKIVGKETNSFPDLDMISRALEATDPDYNYIISARELPDMDELSISDIEMLDKSIGENLHLTFQALSEKSHDMAWSDAVSKKQNSAMNPILMARAGGASEGTIDFIRENNFFS